MSYIQTLNFLCLNLIIFWVLFFVYKPWKQIKYVYPTPIPDVNIFYSGPLNFTQLLTSGNVLQSNVNVYIQNYFPQWRAYNNYKKNDVALYLDIDTYKNYVVTADEISGNLDPANQNPQVDDSQWTEIENLGLPETEYFLYLETLPQFNYVINNNLLPTVCILNNFSFFKSLQIRNNYFDLGQSYSTLAAHKDDQDIFNNWEFVGVTTNLNNKTMIYDTETPMGLKQDILSCNIDDNVATIEVESHGFHTGQWILLENLNTDLDGSYQIKVISEDKFTFETNLVDQTVGVANATAVLTLGCIGFELAPQQSVKLEFVIVEEIQVNYHLYYGTVYVT